MKVLLIDTSSDYLYVSFYDEEKEQRIYYKNIISHNNHSENIIGVIEEGLETNKMSLKDFDKVVIGYGPGSYTGLRVGMVVAKMTSFCCNIPLYVCSSLSFVASKHFTTNGIYAVYNIAKKNHCYMKIVKVIDNNIDIIVDDSFMTDDEFNNIIKDYDLLVVDNDKYAIDEKTIIKLSSKVDNIDEVVPNYLRKANQ